MPDPLVPNVFWFRYAFDVPRVEAPTAASFARTWTLPESSRLPDVSSLGGEPGWAGVRVGWAPSGLGVAVDANADRIPAGEGVAGESLRIWIDTRDTRDVHRATRFCHRFGVLLREEGRLGALTATWAQRPIARALLDAPTAPRDSVWVKVARSNDHKGWVLHLWFGSNALHGYDPEVNRKLGFNFLVADARERIQTFGLKGDFPNGEDPSLWPTIELRDTP